MKKENKLILASGSPRRLDILRQFGYDPKVIVSGFDESGVSYKTPEDLVKKLSCGKALFVRDKADKGDVIIAADTIVVCDGKILGKPHTKKEAVEMLQLLRGRKHQVFSGVTIIHCKDGKNDVIDTFADKTDIYVTDINSLTNCRIHAYVDSGDAMDKAGAYGIQGAFGKYIEKIDGDYYNVVGLPTKAVRMI